jgi:hypothetical protein
VLGGGFPDRWEGWGPPVQIEKSWAGLSSNLIVTHTATTHDSPVVDVVLSMQTSYYDSPAIDSHCYPAEHGLSSPTDIIAYVIKAVYIIIALLFMLLFSVDMLSILCVYVIVFVDNKY